MVTAHGYVGTYATPPADGHGAASRQGLGFTAPLPPRGVDLGSHESFCLYALSCDTRTTDSSTPRYTNYRKSVESVT